MIIFFINKYCKNTNYIIIKLIINKYHQIYTLYFKFIMNNLNYDILLFLISDDFLEKGIKSTTRKN